MNAYTRRSTLGLSLAGLAALGEESSETGVLWGRVTDEERRPLENVLVKAQHTVRGLTMSVSSNRDGEYRFRALPGGSYGLYLAKAGYCSMWIRQVVVRPGATTQRDVTLTLDVSCRPGKR
jgi:hypothetical protein